jgi:hypothetical protein
MLIKRKPPAETVPQRPMGWYTPKNLYIKQPAEEEFFVGVWKPKIEADLLFSITPRVTGTLIPYSLQRHRESHYQIDWELTSIHGGHSYIDWIKELFKLPLIAAGQGYTISQAGGDPEKPTLVHADNIEGVKLSDLIVAKPLVDREPETAKYSEFQRLFLFPFNTFRAQSEPTREARVKTEAGLIPTDQFILQNDDKIVLAPEIFIQTTGLIEYTRGNIENIPQGGWQNHTVYAGYITPAAVFPPQYLKKMTLVINPERGFQTSLSRVLKNLKFLPRPIFTRGIHRESPSILPNPYGLKTIKVGKLLSRLPLLADETDGVPGGQMDFLDPLNVIDTKKIFLATSGKASQEAFIEYSPLIPSRVWDVAFFGGDVLGWIKRGDYIHWIAVRDKVI